jgi:dipeptidyl aminopeptidase/acylaminoacyl peptidase
MKRERILHAVLAVVGIAGLMAYLLACRPAWSPDGSKILFPYVVDSSSTSAIAMYDRNTGKTSTLYTTAPSKNPGKKSVLSAQWTRSGKEVVATSMGFEEPSQELQIILVSLDSPKPPRTTVLREMHFVPGAPLGFPIPEVDGNLYIGCNLLVRMNLETGELQRKSLGDNGGKHIFLLSHGDKIYYCLANERSSPKEPEIGSVDTENLSLKPWFHLPPGQIDEEVAFPFGSVSADGATIAFHGKKDGKFLIFRVAGEKLLNGIPLDLSPDKYDLGNLQWAPDGKTIYAALLTKNDAGPWDLGIAEITVETGAVRTLPLMKIKKSDAMELTLLFFQIAISPDGKTLAVAPTPLRENLVDPQDAALYLLDLADPNRKVTKIPVPSPVKKRP